MYQIQRFLSGKQLQLGQLWEGKDFPSVDAKLIVELIAANAKGRIENVTVNATAVSAVEINK